MRDRVFRRFPASVTQHQFLKFIISNELIRIQLLYEVLYIISSEIVAIVKILLYDVKNCRMFSVVFLRSESPTDIRFVIV